MSVAITSAGALRGARHGEVHVFRGVPYGHAERWRSPAPVPPWAGERDATTFGPIAPQDIDPARLAKRGWTMAEDCLSLNVWTPGIDARRRPVLVFLHGGGVAAGTGSAPLLDGARLAARGDLVVVTVNFRLGALGSLYAPDRAVPNAALRDQLLALEWVGDEIAAFGGDPSQVTVAGQSSGAVAIACLLAGEAARGRFHRAILQSGGLERVRSASAATAVARRFFAALGDAEPTVEAVLAAQATVPTGFVPPEGPWHHCVDGELVPVHPLLAAERLPVPVLAGTTRDEWRAFDAHLTDAEVSEEHLRTRARALLGDDAILDDVLDLYRAERPETDEVERRRAVASALVTDFHFGAPTDQLLRAHAAAGNPCYRYELQWPSPRPGIGACHDSCLPLVFGTMDQVPALVGTGPEVERVSEAVQDDWIAFVHGSAPWAPYPATKLLGAEPVVVDDHRRAHLTTWDGRYPAAG